MVRNTSGGHKIGSARLVKERTKPIRLDATPAGPVRTVLPRKVAPVKSPPPSDTKLVTPTNAEPGSTPGKSESVSESLISSSSDTPSVASTRPWRQPRNVREFAVQTNTVATMVLKGEIELERARVYSGLARTVAQAMSTEVSRARFLAQEPDLSLEDDGDH